MARHYTAQDADGNRYSAKELKDGKGRVVDNTNDESVGNDLDTFAEAKAQVVNLANTRTTES